MGEIFSECCLFISIKNILRRILKLLRKYPFRTLPEHTISDIDAYNFYQTWQLLLKTCPVNQEYRFWNVLQTRINQWLSGKLYGILDKYDGFSVYLVSLIARLNPDYSPRNLSRDQGEIKNAEP